MKRKSMWMVLLLLLFATYSCISNTVDSTTFTSELSTSTTSSISQTTSTVPVNLCDTITQLPKTPIPINPNPTTTITTTKPQNTSAIPTTTSPYNTTTTNWPTTTTTTTGPYIPTTSGINTTTTTTTATTTTTMPSTTVPKPFFTMTSEANPVGKDLFLLAILRMDFNSVFGVQIMNYEQWDEEGTGYVGIDKRYIDVNIVSNDPWIVKEYVYTCSEDTKYDPPFSEYDMSLYFIDNRMIRVENGIRSEQEESYYFYYGVEFFQSIVTLIEMISHYEVSETTLILYADQILLESMNIIGIAPITMIIEMNEGKIVRMFSESFSTNGDYWGQYTYLFSYTPYDDSIIDIDVSK